MFYNGMVRMDVPDTMQIAEVKLLPEAAAETVTDPAGDGEHPQSHRQLGEAQNLLVGAAGFTRGYWQLDVNQNCKLSKFRF